LKPQVCVISIGRTGNMIAEESRARVLGIHRSTLWRKIQASPDMLNIDSAVKAGREEAPLS
jgi:hypothetical protein